MKAPKKEHVYVLRVSGPGGKSKDGFQWPKTGPVAAPDWDPIPECGKGLHGWLWGVGDYSSSDYYAVWQVVEVKQSSIVELNGKVKFPRGVVVFSGSLANAYAWMKFAPHWADCEASATGRRGHASATGRRGHAVATGDRGHASATGDSGHASATGYRGHASATGYRGHASATGYSGHASATGYSGHASATGYSGHAVATGDSGHASATGDSGHASATGRSGHASATGDSGHASATGRSGHASATGRSGHASATSYSGHASATGKGGIAASFDNGRAKASASGAIVLARHEFIGGEWSIAHVFASKVGENGIKPDTWYRLGEDGQPEEVTV